jgi:8-oxo-dGTP pyrophosphatase MutT (NUDIX family)
MSDPTPRPSGTVVVVRDTARLEVLLLARNQRGDGPAPWVFPGGKVEDGDRIAAGEDPVDLARRAAVREAEEEAGLGLDARELQYISRWITPEISPKRFDTWFFLARARADQAITVDGMEIAEHRWFDPGEALAAHHADEIRLAPPTFVTVSWLTEHGDADAALHALRHVEPTVFRPQIHPGPQGAVILYPGDAGYDVRDPERPGARHRLWALRDGYRYERSDD